MSQFEYSVGLAAPKTREDIAALAKAYMEKRAAEELKQQQESQDAMNGES